MTAHEFKQAFLETWRDWTADADGHEFVVNAYQANAEWTNFMLGDGEADGFLHEVAERLNRNVYTEYYNLDCVYYQDEFDLFEGGGYPIGFDAIIEHENGDPPRGGVVEAANVACAAEGL